MTPSGPDAFLLLFLSENLTHIFFTDLKYGGGGWGVLQEVLTVV